mmetsp:Transcript_10136/g.25743  ORF Transcript_10136/g.25743 Transcript_10136/m.25743 type:complete len:233 (+) Transcript_10136:62-760(+)
MGKSDLSDHPSDRRVVREGCLGSRESRHGHARGRARDVLEASPVKKGNRRGVASVFAADAELEIGPRPSPLLAGDLDELSDSDLVDRGKWVLLDDFLFHVDGEEAADIVAADAEAGLRKVVGAKGKEIGGLCDLVGREGRTGELDHRPDLVVDFDLAVVHDLFGDVANEGDLVVEFALEADKRDHAFDVDNVAFGDDLGGGLKDGTSLHFGDFWVGDGEAAAAVAEHGIDFR